MQFQASLGPFLKLIAYNMSIGLGGELFGARAGTITGMIATTSSISTLVTPAIRGWVLDGSNIFAAISATFVFGVAAIAFSLVLKMRYNQLRA